MVLRAVLVAAGLVCLAAVPSASATPALGPYGMSADVTGDARVGGELVVVATFIDHGPGEGEVLFQLEAPDWVDVASSRHWPVESAGGDTYRRAWVLTPTREGVWSAEVTARDPATMELRGSAWLGFKAWSAPGEGRWVTGGEDRWLLSDGGGSGRLTARETSADVYNVTYEATATAPWLRGQNLTLHLGRWVGASAVPVDQVNAGLAVQWRERAVLHERLAIEEGAQRASTAGALYAKVVFPGAVTGDRIEHVMVDCRTITVLPGWQAGLPPQGERDCGDGSAWHSPGPGALVLVTALALLIGFASRRRRTPTGSPSPTCGSA